MTLRVLDKNGRELSVGDRVRTVYDGSEGDFLGPRWWPLEGWIAQVSYVPLGWPGREEMQPAYEPETYRCNDLELTQPPREEAASKAASGRSSA